MEIVVGFIGWGFGGVGYGEGGVVEIIVCVEVFELVDDGVVGLGFLFLNFVEEFFVI